MTAQLTFGILGVDATIELTDFRAIVAGYTGRDPKAVQHHIDELAAIGVAPPPEVPMFYEMDAATVNNSGTHTRRGETLTSGEVEPVYIRHRGSYYLGVGSDHTDRHLEITDIGDSKRACPKPLSRQVIAIDDLAELDLDAVIAECRVDARLYQRGTLSGLRRPADVVALLEERLHLDGADFVCFGGTLPLLSGEFLDGTDWEVILHFPDGKQLQHHYTMKGQNTL